MTTEEKAIAALKALPPDKQQEVLNFIEFLQIKLQQPSEEVSVLEAMGDLVGAVQGPGNLSTGMSRQEIDAALLEMANDPDYQAEALQIEAEFGTAQWEALTAVEGNE